jgi:hypothetical protein
MAVEGQQQELWLPRMAKAFIALEGTSQSIDTAAFATAMQEVRKGQRLFSPATNCRFARTSSVSQGPNGPRCDGSVPGPPPLAAAVPLLRLAASRCRLPPGAPQAQSSAHHDALPLSCCCRCCLFSRRLAPSSSLRGTSLPQRHAHAELLLPLPLAGAGT